MIGNPTYYLQQNTEKIGTASVLLDDLDMGNIRIVIFNGPFDLKIKADRKLPNCASRLFKDFTK